jgi:hypothetical protein
MDTIENENKLGGTMKYMDKNERRHNHSGNAVYGLGFIGASFFFIGKATSFGSGAVGLLKAIVWPAYLVYTALKFLIK